MAEKQVINLAYNKRLLFIGKTRSGKTFLSRIFMRMFARRVPDLQIIIIDPKHEIRKFGKGATLDTPKLVTRYSKVKVQVFQTFEWIPALDEMVDKLLIRGKAIVCLDEMGGIATANSVPSGLIRLWTQGGGKGVGSWALIQYPRRVPLVIKSQSEHFFMFRINNKDDRKTIADFIPDTRIINDVVPPHWFWYYGEGDDIATKFKPVKA